MSRTFPVMVRYPAAMCPVGSVESDIHDTDSTVASTVVGTLVLPSKVDSVSRDAPGIEVSIDAQDQDGARYGEAFAAWASHSPAK
jgi:hypothetical protein